jgi:hypothetical protein
MWVTFASGYQVVYQALVVILAGLILYAFLNARRQRLGESSEPTELPLEELELGGTNGTALAEAAVQADGQHAEVTP